MTCSRGALGALLLLFSTAGQASAEDFAPIIAAAKAGTQTPAMAVLVIRDGKIAGETAAGLRRDDAAELVRPGDVWHIGSDGKVFTAALIARLVDRGVLAWDTPLIKLLPELGSQMRPDYRSVTLAQLLSHRSGLPENISDMKLFEAFYTDRRTLPEQRMAYVARALQEAPIAAPGTRFSYSNTGFILAAVAAERATGSRYEDLVRHEVFEPLGMHSVGFGVTQGAEPLGHRDGKPVLPASDGQPRFTPPDGRTGNPLFFAPAGNMYLTMDDWAAFCLDQMKGANGQGQLLTAESYRLMQTPQAKLGPGLGWGIQESMPGHMGPVLTHSGSDGTWYAIVALFPQTQSGILIVANAGKGMGGDTAVIKALKAVGPSVSPAKR